MENFTSMAILAIFPICMIFATFYDIFTMTIPNKISLILIGSFLILAPLAGVDLHTMLVSFGIAAGVLLLGFLLFSIGQMGAGDAKLLASSSLWFGAASSLDYVLLGTFFGAILTLIIMLFRYTNIPVELLGSTWLNRLYDKKQGIPYGAALGPAALVIFVDSPWMEYITTGNPMG